MEELFDIREIDGPNGDDTLISDCDLRTCKMYLIDMIHSDAGYAIRNRFGGRKKFCYAIMYPGTDRVKMKINLSVEDEEDT